MGLNTPSPTPNSFAINKKIFQIYSLLVSRQGLYSPSTLPPPNFLKEETGTWGISKLLKVSELVNALNLKVPAETLEGLGWVGGEGFLALALCPCPKLHR